LAASNGDCSFRATAFADSTLAAWASTPNVARLAGDFNNDGLTDIALVGGADWTQAKVAFSNGNGTFSILQGSAPNFMFWATSPSAARLVGDFNGDGRSDIALLGDPNWHTIPVAFSNGDASFQVTNADASDFAFWATSRDATKLVGDFNGDGKSDIALVGDPNWHTIPIAFSKGDGSFQISNADVGGFASDWAFHTAERVVGDFNGDGRDDIALIGNPLWHTIPVAFSDGTGAFSITNGEVGSFAVWAALPGVTRLVGDFNGDGRADIALVNVPTNLTAGTIPIAFSNGDGTFRVTMTEFPDGGFRTWAGTANVQAIVGDFNRDGYADIALTGGLGWFTIPCALSKGDGSFLVHNDNTNLRAFGDRSAQALGDRTLRKPGSYR
jgi:FG-GAP-like repeat